MGWAKLGGKCARALSVAAIGAALAADIGGCGFRPLHGSDTSGAPAGLARIRVDRIPDREGQKLRNLLLDRLTPRGPPAQPRYGLRVNLRETLQNLAIRRDESATRANLTITAQFALRRLDTGEVFSATAVSTNSYNILESDFATLSAENDARDRALRFLADDIRSRVAGAMSNPEFFVRAHTPEQTR